MSAIGILATFIVDDLEITRATLGWIVATNVILAAVVSPVAGRATDFVGGRTAAAIVFTSSAVAFVAFGTAPAVWLMFGASAVAAIAQATGNPATNLLIRMHLPEGRRGFATGIKQSGVQAAATGAGLILPSAAIAMGWGTAMALVALLPLLGLVLVLWIVPRSEHAVRTSRSERVRLPTSVRWLAGYGLIFGFAGAVSFYVPLYVEEAIGLDPRIGGLVAAVIGATAFVSRIAWARFAEHSHEYLRPLFIMALGAIGAAILMASGTSIPVLIWPGAVAIGATSSAWNSVGMLAVINKTGAATGRSSGFVVFGFLVGLGIGPPLYGATIDATGSYTPMWMISLAASAVGALIIVLWRRTSGDVWPTNTSAAPVN
jgi:predicted MFS family arabinose efflux permease